MRQEQAIRAYSPHTASASHTPALLQGRLLPVAQTAWLLIAGLSVLLLLAGLPGRFGQLLAVCTGTDCAAWQLSPPAMAAWQAAGFSLTLYAAYGLALFIISALAYLSVAFLIFWRRPRERMALLVSLWLITFGTSLIETGLTWPLLQALWALVDELGWVLLPPLFLLTFPDGRFIPHWTRWLFVAYLLIASSGSLIEFWWPHLGGLETTGGLIWFGMQLTGIGVQVYRYRRISDVAQRQQTRWVVLGLVATAILLAATAAVTELTDLPALAGTLIEMTFVNVAFLILPLALGVSILRYRLWDIDLLVSRALIWGVLTAVVIGAYVLVVGTLATLFQARSTFLPALLATGVIALLFHPLRQRVQQGVNRLVYGQRDEPYRVLSQLGQRLETTLVPTAVLPTIVETVAQTLKLPYVAISLKEGDEFRVAAARGDPAPEALHLPLTYQGETIGQLVCEPRRGEPFSGAERRLLADMARQAGVALHAVRLNADLQRSRERLVVTREEERRRIRRDLHDGLGPALASQTLKIGLARSLLAADRETADSLLQQIEKANGAALEEIRRLVYNLRPPALDELGLLRAIEQEAPRQPGLTITFTLPPELPELSAAVEVAVYRIVQEALANVVRHAQASCVSVRLAIDTDLRLTIADNGRGLPSAYRPGVGLHSMRERAEELGGTFRINASPTTGTTITVNLPLRQKKWDADERK
jgi:signal transduction histidine kinase